MSAKEKFETFAQNKIGEIYSKRDFDDIYNLIAEKDESFRLYPRTDFDFQFLSFRLALASMAWKNACLENGVNEEVIQKLFLRNVLQTFGTKESLPLASVFSEYQYSGDEERPEGDTISMVTTLFRKLEAANPRRVKRVTQQTAESFKAMVEISEGIRVSFQNDFYTLTT